MIGIPCYGSQLFCDFAQSLLKLTKILLANDIKHEVVFLGNESLISRARNTMIAKFYAESDFSHLLFLDADLIFNPECIIKMMGEDKEIIGAPYPKKTYNWDKVKNLDLSNAEEQMDLMTDINYNLLRKGTRQGSVLEVKDIPTGCMLMRRSLITTLFMAYPERKFKNNIASLESDMMPNYFYDLFGTGVVDGYYLSEDYFFCHLIRKLQIPLFLEIGYTFGHIGKQTYYGNLARQFDKYGYGDNHNLDKKTCLKNKDVSTEI